MKIENIGKDAFFSLCGYDRVEANPKYKIPKVFIKESEVLKLFFPKSGLFSSDRFQPYALRFCDNSIKLRSLGFHVPKVKQVRYCVALKTYIVSYDKLAGDDVLTKIGTQGMDLLYQTVEFIARLHQVGVFFRSLHLSNVLFEDDHFGLIDVADVRFKNRPLSLFLRYRNLKHVLTHRDSLILLAQLDVKKLMDAYFKVSVPHAFSRKVLTHWLTKALKK